MKYTPEEMYQYCAGNGLLMGLYIAFNNSEGFDSMPAEGILHVENGKMFVRVKMDENTEDDFEIGEEVEYDEIMASRQGCSPHVKGMICCFGDDYQLTVSFSEKKKEAWKELWEQSFINFLHYMGADTPGRLKAVLRRGLEGYDLWCEAMDFQQEAGIAIEDIGAKTERLIFEQMEAFGEMLGEAGAIKTDEELCRFIGINIEE